ncbi:hypothetical protein Hanom_Chr12g01093591 [Helianthus anomalus]
MFGYFCHFNLKLKSFAYGSLWFQFYCHFGPKLKSVQISKKTWFFVLFLSFVKGILVITRFTITNF